MRKEKKKNGKTFAFCQMTSQPYIRGARALAHGIPCYCKKSSISEVGCTPSRGQ